VALAYIATLDDEKRFRKSIDVGAFLGLTPKRHQSGAVDWSVKITKCGDCDMRRLLYSAASTLISCTRKPPRLKEWATKLAERMVWRGARDLSITGGSDCYCDQAGGFPQGP
jgi:transposase